MNSRQFQYILKVAEEKNISRAAEKLYIAQAYLSQFISKIEKNLGIKLFDRSSNPISLTYEGKLYIEMAKKMIDLDNQFKRNIQDVADCKKGSLTIGIPATTGSYVLPKVIPKFKKVFPHINLNLKEESSSTLEDLTLQGEVDFCLTSLKSKEKGLIYKQILALNVFVVVDKDHKLNQNNNKNVPLDSLVDENFVLLRQGQYLRQLSDKIMRESNFIPKIFLECRNIETLKSLVSKQMGITFLSEIFIWENKNIENLSFLKINGLKEKWKLYIAYRENGYLTKAALYFIEELKLLEEMNLCNIH